MDMGRIEYYAIAVNPATGNVAELHVIREGGRQISQTWTGLEFKNTKEGLRVTGAKNIKMGQ
jgi:hypothetical protein